jgi:hypothetical protein
MLQTIKISTHIQAVSGKTKSEPLIASNYTINNVAKWLKAKYGMEFNPKSLPIATRLYGTFALHNFDLVSSDNQIVAKVITHTVNPSGNIPSAKILDTYIACEILKNVTAKTKLLIITDFAFYESFKNNSKGRISRQIKIFHSPDKQSSVLPH